MSLFVMVVGRRLEMSRSGLHLRPDYVLTISEERSWGIFYRGPTVSAKCTYQNLKLTDVKGRHSLYGLHLFHTSNYRCPLLGEHKGGPTK